MMNSKAEKFIQDTILPELEKGRPGWDKPHTLGVVKYIKHIMQNNPELYLDAEVLIPAAYAHDWGYGGMFVAGRPATQAEIGLKKQDHMELGAQKVEALLENPVFYYLSADKKSRIVHLVAVHDQIDILKDRDEIALMEADTLSVADPRVVMPTHTKEEYERYLKIVEQDRISRFLTSYSKNLVRELLKLRADWYASH